MNCHSVAQAIPEIEPLHSDLQTEKLELLAQPLEAPDESEPAALPDSVDDSPGETAVEVVEADTDAPRESRSGT